MSGFNITVMLQESLAAITDFVKMHQHETFYAFSVDASLLCLNSLEQFEKTLKQYQEIYPGHYESKESILDLKFSTGDWKYQGFFKLNKGFDAELYNDHYHIPFNVKTEDEQEIFELQQQTPYHLAMVDLLDGLLKNNAFGDLNKTSDFKNFLSEHTY